MSGLIVIGAGGHANSVIDALRSAGIEPSGAIDREQTPGQTVGGLPVIGSDADLERLFCEGTYRAVLGIGSVGDTTARRAAVERASAMSFHFETVVHRTAYVSPNATLGTGVFIGAGAVVGPGVTVGDFAIVNSGAVIDHDCMVGAFAHIAPSATLSGDVIVGDDAHVGTGASVIQGARIGTGAVIGVGSVVVDDIDAGTIAFGNPCRPKAGE
ncbi:MAG TPA: acetyltransferase [Coriobacteriia bacterium]|nr:acetyltransferase [Coriobacteriia bacterium]